MSEWFEDWFASDQYLNVYKHRDEKDALKLLNLITKSVTLSKSDLILDAACGAGRYTKLLFDKGYKAIGFDLSLPLLKVAHRNLNEFTNENIYFRADIRSVQLKRKLNLILNVFTSFGYFENDEENFRFIKNSINFLKPGGYFVFDYLNKDQLVTSLVPESLRETEVYVIKEKRRIENERVIKDIEIQQKSNGDKKEFTESVKLYSRERLIDEFNYAGYKLMEICGDYEGSTFDQKLSPRIIMILKNEN